MPKKGSKEQIEKFLKSTGFPFEMSVAKTLGKKGYEVSFSYNFFDLEENKSRELDLLANKKINGIDVNLIVECKQSLRDNWIFVSPEKSRKRYWSYMKHLPEIKDYKDKGKCFAKLHPFNRDIVLANNFITFDVDKNKQSDSKQIKDSINKVIKATFFVMGNVYYSNEKRLFFPVVFFSGDIFTAIYDKKLIVKKNTFLQYKTEFISQAYEVTSLDYEKKGNILEFDPFHSDKSWKTREREDMILAIKKNYSDWDEYNLVNIVKKTFISSYLNMIDKEVGLIPVKNWK